MFSSGSEIDLSGIPNSVLLDEFLDSGLDQEGLVPHLEFEQVDH